MHFALGNAVQTIQRMDGLQDLHACNAALHACISVSAAGAVVLQAFNCLRLTCRAVHYSEVTSETPDFVWPNLA